MLLLWYTPPRQWGNPSARIIPALIMRKLPDDDLALLMYFWTDGEDEFE